METIRLVFQDGKSHKFWSVSVTGTTQTVHYGRVGTNGQTRTKEFGSDEEAIAASRKIADQKRKKGYVDHTDGEQTAPAQPAGEASHRLQELLALIEAHLFEADEELHEDFTEMGPATENAIARAEKDLGVELPEDYKAFLRIRNGTSDLADVIWGGLHQIEDIADVTARCAELERDPDAPLPPADQVDARIKREKWNDGWVVITTSARGRDHICIDLDPAEPGTHGQIFEFAIDDSGRRWVAASFTEYLDEYYYCHLLEERDEPEQMVRL